LEYSTFGGTIATIKLFLPWRSASTAQQKAWQMTLEAYDADQLDQLALRVFDLAAVLRKMAETQRKKSLGEFLLHDKKAVEWIARLEQWARRADAEMQMQQIRVQADADARRATSYTQPKKKRKTVRNKKS